MLESVPVMQYCVLWSGGGEELREDLIDCIFMDLTVSEYVHDNLSFQNI